MKPRISGGNHLWAVPMLDTWKLYRKYLLYPAPDGVAEHESEAVAASDGEHHQGEHGVQREVGQGVAYTYSQGVDNRYISIQI